MYKMRSSPCHGNLLLALAATCSIFVFIHSKYLKLIVCIQLFLVNNSYGIPGYILFMKDSVLARNGRKLALRPHPSTVHLRQDLLN